MGWETFSSTLFVFFSGCWMASREKLSGEFISMQGAMESLPDISRYELDCGGSKSFPERRPELKF